MSVLAIYEMIGRGHLPKQIRLWPFVFEDRLVRSQVTHFRTF